MHVRTAAEYEAAVREKSSGAAKFCVPFLVPHPHSPPPTPSSQLRPFNHSSSLRGVPRAADLVRPTFPVGRVKPRRNSLSIGREFESSGGASWRSGRRRLKRKLSEMSRVVLSPTRIVGKAVRFVYSSPGFSFSGMTKTKLSWKFTRRVWKGLEISTLEAKVAISVAGFVRSDFFILLVSCFLK